MSCVKADIVVNNYVAGLPDMELPQQLTKGVGKGQLSIGLRIQRTIFHRSQRTKVTDLYFLLDCVMS